MIETVVGVLVVGLLQVAVGLFGYYSAVKHVRRMLDIEQPEEPTFVTNARKDLRADGALTADDIDEIDDWDDVDDFE